MKKLFLILFSVLVLSTSINAQELNATVNVNVDNLGPADKDRVSDFGSEIQDYLNNTKFTGDNWEWGRISCNFEVFLIQAVNETNYTAKVAINSIRPIEGSGESSLMFFVLDSDWAFEYKRGQSLYFSPADFDNLLSFLNFYAYVIIGLDMDSYGPDPLGGSELFTKAFDIALLSATKPGAQGWEFESSSYNRRGLVSDLVKENYNQLRIDFMNYHFNGLDIYTRDKNMAMKNMEMLVMNLDKKKDQLDPRSVWKKVFFDSKWKELVKYLSKHKNNIQIFSALKMIDPPHISKYNEAIDR